MITTANLNAVQQKIGETNHWLLKVVYDFENEACLNPELTFRQVLKEAIVIDPETTFIQAHDLDEKTIRELSVIHQKESYAALNAQSFFDFIINQFQKIKIPPQTVARFKIASVGFGETISFKQKLGKPILLEFKPLPWRVSEIIESREIPISPRIQSLDYFVDNKKIVLILSYPTSEKNQVILHYIDSIYAKF